MVDTIHHDDLSGLGAAAVDEVPGFDKAPLDDIVTMTFPVDPRIKDKVQTEVKLTASALPLVVNDAVLGYINYFNGRGHKTIEGGLERAGKYQPMIARILAEEGIPQELIHLAQAESGFLPRAVSRAAAEGMWQFVKFRGNQYGLMQTPYSDDRLIPKKPRAPPPTTCTISITNLATGIWRLPPITADPARSNEPWSAPATRISGNCARAGCIPVGNHELCADHSRHDDHGEECARHTGWIISRRMRRSNTTPSRRLPHQPRSDQRPDGYARCRSSCS